METSPGNEVMHSVDHAWLQMDEPHNPMIVAGLLELDDSATPALIRATITERLLRYPRFCQHPDDQHQPPLWVGDAVMNMDYHIQLHALPKACYPEALRTAVGKAVAEPLDHSRPLWRMFIYHGRGQSRTLLFRAHHALADGMALVGVLLACTDAVFRKRRKLAATPSHERLAHSGPLGGLIDRLESANRLLGGLGALAADDLQHPSHLKAQLRQGKQALLAVRRVLALPHNNPAALCQPLSGQREVAWRTQIPFAPIRRLAHQLEVKINDLFIAALAGAFGRELRARGEAVVEGQNLRISIPVNLREADDGELGNCFGLVLVDLPIGIADPQQRLQIVAERLHALKTSPEAQATLMSLAAADHLPAKWEKKLIMAVGGKAAAVVSNLPGPKRAAAIAGAKVQSLVFWPPQTGAIGIGVSLFSYGGSVSFGVSADRAVLPEPQVLLDAFVAELAALQLLARPAKVARPPSALRASSRASGRSGVSHDRVSG